MIQMPRPCVASTRSCVRGCTTRSRTATDGKSLPLYCAQRWPPSMLIHRPNSVPRNSRLGFDGVLLDHVGVAADAVLLRRGSAVQVLPKSVVR